MQIKTCNNNSAKNNQPAFKMKISFIDADNFARIRKSLRNAYEVGNFDNFEWTLDQAAINKTKAFTQGIRSCTTGIIINPKTKKEYMFHLSPDECNCNHLKEIKQTIINEATKLKNSTNTKLQGLIIGANNSHYRYDLSYELLQNVQDIFKTISDRLGMSYSVFAGRKDLASEVNIIADARSGISYVNTNSDFIKINKPSNILKYFEINNLSDEDEIIMNNQNMTNEFLEFTKKPKNLMDRLKRFLQSSFI